MSFFVGAALKPVEAYCQDAHNVELVKRTQRGLLTSFRVKRETASHLHVWADVNEYSVMIGIGDAVVANKAVKDRYGTDDAERAAALAIDFVSFTGDDELYRVFVLHGRRPTVHELKCWPSYFAPLYLGKKSFEFRKNDRGFEVGDVLKIREWQPGKGFGDVGRHTGNEFRRLMSYVLRGPDVGVPEGYCVMSLAPMP